MTALSTLRGHEWPQQARLRRCDASAVSVHSRLLMRPRRGDGSHADMRRDLRRAEVIRMGDRLLAPIARAPGPRRTSRNAPLGAASTGFLYGGRNRCSYSTVRVPFIPAPA